MTWAGRVAMCVTMTAGLVWPWTVTAQEMPGEYKSVLTALGKTGDFKDGVLKVNIPRTDLRVTIGQRPVPTPFGFGGWVAFTKAPDGADVMMGDLVLAEDEVNPVMSAVLDSGLEVTALHNHFFWEHPRVFYMHVHGMGRAPDIATRLKPAIDLINQALQRAGPPATATGPAMAPLDGAALAKIVGHAGEQNGPVYKITIGRPDIDLRAHGAVINARMGVNTWAAFAGTPAEAMVAGDVAMRESELPAVLKVLRAHKVDIVAIHHHMTDVSPMVVFLHYFGTGPAESLAKAVRAALDTLGSPSPAGQASAPVVFVCQRGGAKSPLAAAYFNKMAAERGMSVRATFRAVSPQDSLSPDIVEGLEADGVAIPAGVPTALGSADVAGATHVFAMGCELPRAVTASGKALTWDIPSDGGYGPMRDAIVARVRALLDQIQRAVPE